MKAARLHTERDSTVKRGEIAITYPRAGFPQRLGSFITCVFIIMCFFIIIIKIFLQKKEWKDLSTEKLTSALKFYIYKNAASLKQKS